MSLTQGERTSKRILAALPDIIDQVTLTQALQDETGIPLDYLTLTDSVGRANLMASKQTDLADPFDVIVLDYQSQPQMLLKETVQTLQSHLSGQLQAPVIVLACGKPISPLVEAQFSQLNITRAI